MPFDTLGGTRATMDNEMCSEFRNKLLITKVNPGMGQFFAIFELELGIPCKHAREYHAEYVPAVCTHRPSFLPTDTHCELQGSFIGELPRMLCIGGRKSRNKVIVGEPAIGSILMKFLYLKMLSVLQLLSLLVWFKFRSYYGGCLGLQCEEGQSQI